MKAPLHGVLVVDLTSVIMGPFASQILGDLGADVIKVESPAGDTNRYINPGRNKGMSGTVMNLHRNKRSIVLDLKHPDGKAALLRLVKKADVLIHNIRPGAIERLGLRWEDVEAINPTLVYCSTCGFSGKGPYADRPAYDDLIQGASGIADLNAKLTGEPSYFPGTICDKVVGISAVYAVVAALYQREKTGRGQRVEVPMYETMVAFNLVEHMCDSVFEPAESAVGYQRVLNPNRRPYKTADNKYICLVPYTDANWQDFFVISGRTQLSNDARFKNLTSRTEHIEELYGIIDQAVVEKTADTWLALCADKNIPCQLMNELHQVNEDPHLLATDFFTQRSHASEGNYWHVAAPIDFSGSTGEEPRDAPRLGQHSVEVLDEIGNSETEISALIARGVSVDGSVLDNSTDSRRKVSNE